MASSSLGTSSSGCSTQVPTTTSSSERGFYTAAAAAVVPDQRKQKRMLSNRESARRSRQRKQKHLDELNAQVNQLKIDNSQIALSLSETLRHYMIVEANNSVLRTQMVELGTRLQSLHEILYGTHSFQIFDK